MRARFKVKNGFAIQGRGPVLAGDIVDGTIRFGMRVVFEDMSPCLDLTVSAIEMIDYADRSFRVGLMFREQPEFGALQAAIPPGTILDLQDDAAD